MLMINRVELHMLDQVTGIGKLQHDPSPGFHQRRKARHEIIGIWNMRKDVVAEDQIRAPALGSNRPRGLQAEEGVARRDAALHGDLRDVACRFDAQTGNARRHKVAQEIPVIARHLHHQAPGIQ